MHKLYKKTYILLYNKYCIVIIYNYYIKYILYYMFTFYCKFINICIITK